MPTVIAKGAGGAVVKVPTAIGQVKNSQLKNKTPSQSMIEGRAKAKARREVASNAKLAEAGGKANVKHSENLEREFINTWLDGHSYIVYYLASTLRNGTLESNYRDAMAERVAAPVVSGSNGLGKRCFAEGALKWRSLKSGQAPSLLADLLQKPDVVEWFRGEDKLPITLAAKAVRFELGVDDCCDAPGGCEYGAFQGPLAWLGKKRVADIGGSKLANATKDTLDSLSDWFSLKSDGKGVQCHTAVVKDVQLEHIKMADHTDWCILDAGSYAKARLVSESAGVDMFLARPFQKHHEAPVFAQSFNFPDNEVPPCIPIKAVSQTSPMEVSPGSSTASPLKINIPLPP